MREQRCGPVAFVQVVHWYYANIRLLIDDDAGLMAFAFPSLPEGCLSSGDDEISQFLCEGFPRMLRVSDGVEQLSGSRCARPTCCLPLRITASALQTSDFAAQWLACGSPCRRFKFVLTNASA
ncbi:hypothetical protein XI07_04855 [Bradyrhizobium sp. CCBAU 11445]|nr:hypothetical protein [Bradyrhizobium sp. CCBAU 11445]